MTRTDFISLLWHTIFIGLINLSFGIGTILAAVLAVIKWVPFRVGLLRSGNWDGVVLTQKTDEALERCEGVLLRVVRVYRRRCRRPYPREVTFWRRRSLERWPVFMITCSRPFRQRLISWWTPRWRRRLTLKIFGNSLPDCSLVVIIYCLTRRLTSGLFSWFAGQVKW